MDDFAVQLMCLTLWVRIVFNLVVGAIVVACAISVAWLANHYWRKPFVEGYLKPAVALAFYTLLVIVAIIGQVFNDLIHDLFDVLGFSERSLGLGIEPAIECLGPYCSTCAFSDGGIPEFRSNCPDCPRQRECLADVSLAG